MTTDKKLSFPYLVQRVIPLEEKRDGKAVDQYFSFDYMGSAEFEFGALGDALKYMRAVKKEDWKPEKLKSEKGEVCWYVGPEELKFHAKEFFEKELNRAHLSNPLRLKERTQIEDAYGRTEWDSRAKAWWSIVPKQPFIFFMYKKDAERWLSLL